MINAPLVGQGMSTAAAGNAANLAGQAGIIGKTLEAGGEVAGWLGKYPGAAMVLGQGVSGAVQSYQAGKAAEEQRAYDDQKEAEAGFFGMDKVGTQINLPTVGLIGNTMTAPAVEAPATQTEIAQQSGAAANVVDPYALTPAQFLEYQRSKLIPPTV